MHSYAHNAHVRTRFVARAANRGRRYLNPLAAKLIIYMPQFPIIEGVLPFMESHLTLCSLHKGLTSQDNFAGAAAALEALTDICESPTAGVREDKRWKMG